MNDQERERILADTAQMTFIEVTIGASKKQRWNRKLIIGTHWITEIDDGPSGCEIHWHGEAVIVEESYAQIKTMLGLSPEPPR